MAWFVPGFNGVSPDPPRHGQVGCPSVSPGRMAERISRRPAHIWLARSSASAEATPGSASPRPLSARPEPAFSAVG
jgi:hypothetical protein